MGQCNREESRNIIVSPSMLPLLGSSKHLKYMGNSSAPLQGLLFLLQSSSSSSHVAGTALHCRGPRDPGLRSVTYSLFFFFDMIEIGKFRCLYDVINGQICC